MPNLSIKEIEETELFNGVNRDFLESLNLKEYIELPEGDIIFKSGDPVVNMFIVAEGIVKLKIPGGLGSPVIVIKKKGQHFGELEILNDSPRKSSAVADTKCSLLVLSRSIINKLLETSPEIKKNLSSGLKIPEGIRRRDIIFSEKKEKISDLPFLKVDKINFNDPEDVLPDTEDFKETISPQESFDPEKSEILLPPENSESTGEVISKPAEIEPDNYDYSQNFSSDENAPGNDFLSSPEPESFPLSDLDNYEAAFPPEPEYPADELSDENPDSFSFQAGELPIEDVNNFTIPLDELPDENVNKFTFPVDELPDENVNKFTFPVDELPNENVNTFTAAEPPVDNENTFSTEENIQDFSFTPEEPSVSDRENDISFIDNSSDIILPPDYTFTQPNEQPRKQEIPGDETYLDILVAIQKIVSSVITQDVFKNVTEAVSELIKCSSAFLYISENESNLLTDASGNKFDKDNSVPGICYSSKEILYNEESLFVPIENKDGNVSAVLQLNDKYQGTFSNQDENIIKAVAPFIDDIINNSRLLNPSLSDIQFRALGTGSKLLSSDIKRPLLMIRHYVEYLKQKQTDEDGRRILDLISEQAGGILELNQTVKEFAEGSLKVNLIEIEITHVMEEYLSLIAEYTDSRKVKVLRKYEARGTALIDNRKLYQAIYQIVKNACDSMSGGGKLYFIVRRNDSTLEIEIKDEGVGIPEEILPDITKPFFTYGKKEAAGLGLNIAEDIIKKHNGQLTYISKPGEGSSFTITLPAADIF